MSDCIYIYILYILQWILNHILVINIAFVDARKDLFTSSIFIYPNLQLLVSFYTFESNSHSYMCGNCHFYIIILINHVTAKTPTKVYAKCIFILLLLRVFGPQTSNNRNCSYWYHFIPLNQSVIHTCVTNVVLILSRDCCLICWCSEFVILSTSFGIIFSNQRRREWAIFHLFNSESKFTFEQMLMAPVGISTAMSPK